MKYVFSIVVLFLFSCSTDSVTENINTETQISGYKVTTTSQSTDSNFPYIGQTIRNGIVQNGKIVQINDETFINGTSQGINVNESLIYQDNLLVSHVDHFSSNTGRVLNFYYDTNSRLIGCTRIINNMETYYRFVYITNDLIYFEKISLPYNDSNAQIETRNIVVFEGDEIVQGGRDSNLDGVMDNVNYFQYSSGNLISATNSAQSLTINYSNVRNNMNILYDNSYGKKNRRIICAECFSLSGFEAVVLGYSKNLTNDELLESTYEIHTSNYYHLKSNSYVVGPPAINFNATVARTTEFFFN
jgi:hypothetical protein